MQPFCAPGLALLLRPSNHTLLWWAEHASSLVAHQGLHRWHLPAPPYSTQAPAPLCVAAQVDPEGVGPDLERLLVDKLGYKVGAAGAGGGGLAVEHAHAGLAGHRLQGASSRPDGWFAVHTEEPAQHRVNAVPASACPSPRLPVQEPSVMVAALVGLRELIKRDPAPYRNLAHYFTNILKQAGAWESG